MANKPVIMMVGSTRPPEVQERYNKWWDAVYVTLYMKPKIVKRIERYEIIRKSHLLPNEIRVFHCENLESWIKQSTNVDRVAAIRDQQTTFFPTSTRFWHSVYELATSFKKAPSSQGTIENTIVADAPVIHIEGYRIPENDYGNYENWFNRWACHVYIPLLLKIPGVKACNFFKLVEYNDPVFAGVRFVEPDMPRYFSIIYFENAAAVESFNQSPELAAFRGSIELGLPNMKTLWDAECQFIKAYEPQP